MGLTPLPIRRGAYVLSDMQNPQAVIIATGSETALAMQAQEVLAEQGIASFGESAPAQDLFAHFGITAGHVADAVRALVRRAEPPLEIRT